MNKLKEMDRKELMMTIIARVFTVCVMIFITGFYLQNLPVFFVFTGGLVGIESDTENMTDLMFWALVSMGAILPVIYAYIKGLGWFWTFMKKYPVTKK